MTQSKRILKISFLVLIAIFGMSATVNNNGKYFEISKNIEIFTNLYKEINTFYVDDIDPAKLMRTGIDAMLESLDPYTNYISESEIEGFRFMTEGRSNGIGATIKKYGNDITITRAFADSPALKAGLKPGDIILSVDGKTAIGKSRGDVNNILKGYPGTEVLLNIKRPGEAKELSVKLVREEVKVSNVPFSGMINDKVGYIALTTFTRNAGKNVADALKKLKDENAGIKGIIFDLRENGGGLLTEAVNVSNVFIPKGELVVTTKGKVADWDRSFKTLNNPIDQELPLVILMDNGTASASEIVSGVIQDLDRGVLLGQRSYGKGLVQNTKDVGYNSKVKMTMAKYYIPSGRCIQAVSYANGKPIHIPDSKRTPFKTRKKRLVYDGGGLQPDVSIKDATSSQIIRSLREQHMIFHFATDYCMKNNNIASPQDFRFSNFNDFTSFLNMRNFDYKTDSEKVLDQLKGMAKDENYLSDIESNIKSVQSKIDKIKKTDLEMHKKEIIDLIEKEVISRTYYQKGRIQIGLRNDMEITKAVELLGNTAEYNKLLSGQ